MSELLKRFSINLSERMSNNSMSQSDAMPGTVKGVPSFNDFSMHVADEFDNEHYSRTVPSATETRARSVNEPRRSYDVHHYPFQVGSAPAGISPIATRPLMVPTKTSVAHILGRNESGSTPRSSLDQPNSSRSTTPRASFSTDEPGSPRSPTSPGARRRRQQKIHGMDYYEFCELVRAGSL